MVRVLGSGGMATVFQCEDERLGRQVAVKRLHAHSPDETARRFVREAKLGASLNHPNLVSVFDTVTDDEGVLIVMELVKGETLADAIRRGPLPTKRAVSMLRDVAEGLDHAHAHGVVHRDIKPANVLVREDGVAKLTDLGIATAADHTQITASGIVLGTAAYMAPEQLEGGEAGPPVDVYALAVIAFEALSGRKARQGRTPLEIAHEVAVGGPPDLQEVWSEAPPEAAEVLCRGMAREPRDRPESAGELVAELDRALQDVGDTRVTEERPRTGEERPGMGSGALAAGGGAAAGAMAAAAAADRAAERTEPGARPADAAPAARPAHSAPPPEPPRGLYDDERSERPRRRPAAAVALAAFLLALAGAATAFALLSGGDDGEPTADRGADSAPADKPAAKEKKPKPKQEQQQQEEPAPPAQQPAQPEEQPAEQPAPPATGATRGAQLNEQGFARMQQGDYAGAVPILQQAVAAFPEGTDDLNLAYALFNLGKSLNRSGRPQEAIPYLEQRLSWSDQRATVQAELDAAKKAAGKKN